MANSVLKLTVDASEYDAKIKKAAEGLQQYAQKCHETGGTLEFLDDGVLEFVQALGKMEAESTKSRQQLREMSNAVTDLTMVYRGLSDVEKQSPFGQELAKGIEDLTKRASDAKDAMADVDAAIRNAASDTRVFDQVASAATGLSATFQTAQGAAKMFGIQLGDNVEVLAKLQAAMAVTSGLKEMQNLLQKQSALMQGVNALQKEFNLLAKANPYVLLATAATAVVAAYAAWATNAAKAEKAQKALNAEISNTKNQIAQIDKDTDFSVGIAQAAGKSWKAIHELRLEAARTKLQLADMNYDKLFASGASAEQLKQAAEMQQQAWDNVMKVLNEGTIHDVQRRNGTGPFATKGNKSTKQEDTNFAADSIMAQEKEVQRLTDAWNRASGAMRDGILKDLEAAKAKLEAMKNGMYDAGQLGEVVVTGSKMPSIIKNYASGANNLDTLNTYISGIRDQLKNADLGSDLYNSLTEKLRDATTMSTLLQELMERGLQGADLETTAQALKEKMLSPEGIDQEAVQKWLEGVSKQIEDAGGIGMVLNAQTGAVEDKKGSKEDGKSFEDFSKGLSTVASGLNSVTSGLKTLGLEIPAEFGELMNVMSGIGQIISGVQAIISLTQTPAQIANTTAIGLNTAAIGGLIAALEVNTATNFIPFLANGGIVPTFAHGGLIGRAAGGLMIPGNSMSGDRLRLPVDGGRGWIGVNSGELILNRAQQGNLASQLEGGVAAAVNTQPFINGEQIFLGLQAYMRRSGLGEIVTSER